MIQMKTIPLLLLALFLVACQGTIQPQKIPLETFNIGPELKDCVGVGPQKCMVVNDKFFYDSIEGFDYQAGYEYELLVEKTERENVPADASKYTYTLVEIVSKEAVIPDDCATWFDGCNNCVVGEDGVMACTKKACFEMQNAECVAFKDKTA